VDDYIFEYKDSQSYTSNFLRWRARNNEEKELYRQEKYSLLEAKEVFDNMYRHKKQVDESWRDGTIWKK
tara:strand:- start:315 stop:521 length:207 start_codon:yes stop_codon:yes gene_type:complete